MSQGRFTFPRHFCWEQAGSCCLPRLVSSQHGYRLMEVVPHLTLIGWAISVSTCSTIPILLVFL